MTDDTPRTILYVEDDPSILEMCVLVLEDAGYRVLTATTGPAALLALLNEHIDLIVLDVLLPGMGGFEVAVNSRQQQTTRHVPILFVSAVTDPFRQAQARTFGGDDYLTKPFDVTDLLEHVAALLPPSTPVVTVTKAAGDIAVGVAVTASGDAAQAADTAAGLAVIAAAAVADAVSTSADAGLAPAEEVPHAEACPENGPQSNDTTAD